MTLTEFLLARIAEDEAVAIAAVQGFTEGDFWRDGNTTTLASARHVASHGPARVLAECEAKRRIVAGLSGVLAQSRNEQQIQNAQTTLGHLAAVYADHPDYRDEWRA